MIRVTRWLIIAVICIASVSVYATRAQDTAPTFSLRLIAGTCTTPGDTVANLESLTTAATGDAAGTSDPSVVFRSYSVAPVTIESLLASPHALAVLDAQNATVACGDLVGAPDPSGAVAIGLGASSDAGVAGIAYLSPASGGTGISTFVAHIGGQVAATPALANAEYAPTMRSQVSLVVASLQRIDALFNAPNASDPQWVTKVLAECSLWHMLYREAEAITPPDTYAGFHQRYLEALALLDSAADDISAGITGNDSARLQQAEPKITDAVAILRSLDSDGSPATPVSSPVALDVRKYVILVPGLLLQ